MRRVGLSAVFCVLCACGLLCCCAPPAPAPPAVAQAAPTWATPSMATPAPVEIIEAPQLAAEVTAARNQLAADEPLAVDAP